MADQSFAKSLQKRIVIYSAVGMLAVGLAVALAGILPLAVQLRQAQEKNLQVDLRRQTRAVEQYVTRARAASSFRFTRGRLREQLDAYARGELAPDELRRAAGPSLQDSLAQSSNTMSLYLLDTQTNVLVQLGQPIPRELWVIPEAGARDPMLSGPRLLGRDYDIISASPLFSSQGIRIGSTLALYRTEMLRPVIEDYAELGASGETIVGDLTNKELPVFFPFRPLRRGLADDERQRAAVRRALASAQQGRTGLLLPDESPDPSIVLAYGPIEGVPWGLVIKKDRREFFAPVNRQLASVGSLTFGLVLLGVVAMILALRPLAGRVLLHTDELESQIYEKTAALNTELGERTRAEKSLRDSEALYHSLVDTLPINILRKDLAGRVTYGNRGYSQMMGKPMEQLLGQTDFDLFPRELAEKYSRDDDKVVHTGRMFEDVEENRLPGGRTTYVHVLKAPVRNAKGDIVGTQVIFWDVTARKQAELSLAQANAELGRSNKELEQFAYVASHDLQEPLRMITSYTQLIAKRYHDKLDQDARDFMDFAVNGALRMQRLIHDLLAYSRVGTRGSPPEPVQAALAVEAALDNLKLACEEAGAEVTRDPMPAVLADPAQLTQLFQNLIGNALKFRGQEKPCIHLGVQREAGVGNSADGEAATDRKRADEVWHFTVRDNGIGIDPQYFGKIFIIFQRLHPTNQYPGTGIGLAICKKIIDRHGGRIWVESAPGAGATFHFTLPA
jgi:PAS domain S-box-containing protein